MSASVPPAHTAAAPVPAPVVENTFGRAFLASLVWVAAGLLLITVLFAASPGLSYALGAAFGQSMLAALLAAWATWAITRRADRWAFWQLILLALPFFVLADVVLGLMLTAQNHG